MYLLPSVTLKDGNANRFHRKRKLLKSISKGTSMFEKKPPSLKG